MNCEDARRRLDDYADGSLPELERHEIDGHLSSCEGCREEAESIRGLLADLKALPREIAPDTDMWPAIAERTRGGNTVKVDFRRWARSGAIAAMAAAAVVVIAVASTLVVEWQTEQLAAVMQRREYRAPALLVPSSARSSSGSSPRWPASAPEASSRPCCSTGSRSPPCCSRGRGAPSRASVPSQEFVT